VYLVKLLFESISMTSVLEKLRVKRLQLSRKKFTERHFAKAKSVTLNNLERRNGPYFALFTEFVYDVVVKKVYVRYLIS